MISKSLSAFRMAIDNNRRDDDLKKLFGLVKDLENKSVQLEENQFKEKTENEQFKLNVQMSLRMVNGLNERVKEMEEHDENHEERLKELENLTKELQNKMMFMKPGDGEGFDADVFAKLLEQYTNKADFESLKERVEKLEKELDEHKSKSKKKLKKHKE